ncbi:MULTISPECIES: GIY-YIG nuclease family protein [Alphaproteobacteria]|uniref:GIY-YIG nuclease family protein n=1 Tax=Alphaproteobacteria TaxID=28211 RepID=UPI0027307FC4|nr:MULTISPECIES: GIY-YIG nuclease family protein [Alphaproteobacteria]MDP1626766.1 GIY-YIG nuclease family protein [Parvibaculum sp.]MDP2213806.1 GIY-YIG nuclease family protein [Phenylobacterium sp.]MDP3329771.1 GIY-YIG nuclease family protein [Parvibaculum sp.]
MSYFVYILTNQRNGTLYVGVTNDIARRAWEHREGTGSQFTRKYGVHRLVYAETHDDAEQAIRREKALKEWKRDWKIELIEGANPNWNDLTDTLNR